MLPISPKQVLRFTPPGHESDDAPPVYLIRPASKLDKMAWRRAMTAAGLRIATDADLLEALRAEVRAAEPENAAALIETLDQFEAAGDAADDTLRDTVGGIERAAARLGGRYAEMAADRQMWLEAAPLFAFRQFVTGWENLAVPFQRRQGLVAEEAVDALPADHVTLAGIEAMRLMSPSKDQEKNSASPLPSPCGPAISTAASVPATADPAGRSPESSTSATPASTSTPSSSSS